MKKIIAVSATSKNGLESIMDERFGRAPNFICVDLDNGGVLEQFDNNTADAAHGAGTGTAAMLAKRAVSIVISHHFGPKAADALSKFKIEMWCAPKGKTVKDAVIMYNRNQLSREGEETSC